MSTESEGPPGPVIAVCGGQHCTDEVARAAETVGRLIGEAGAVLVCGGLTGVMEAACRGAAKAGGVTIGILPGKDRTDANEYVTYAIATGIGHARNSIVVGSADAAVAVDGEFGTLSEIAFAARLGIPVVGLRTWAIKSPTGTLDPIIVADGPEDAVRIALEAAASSAS